LGWNAQAVRLVLGLLDKYHNIKRKREKKKRKKRKKITILSGVLKLTGRKQTRKRVAREALLLVGGASASTYNSVARQNTP
jgi:hypothetical protein